MPPFTRLIIPDLLLAEVIEHALTDSPIECCGLLLGYIANGVGTVTTRFPIENALHSPTEYETDARGMIAAFRHMREHKLELLAIYHSHPTSGPVPSKRDVERNTYGETVVHLIVGLAGSEPVVRAWWLTETGYREAESRYECFHGVIHFTHHHPDHNPQAGHAPPPSVLDRWTEHSGR